MKMLDLLKSVYLFIMVVTFADVAILIAKKTLEKMEKEEQRFNPPN